MCNGTRTPRVGNGLRTPRADNGTRVLRGLQSGEASQGMCNGSRTPRGMQRDKDPKGFTMGRRIPRCLPMGQGSQGAASPQRSPPCPPGARCCSAGPVGSPTATGEASTPAAAPLHFPRGRETNVPVPTRLERGEPAGPIPGERLPVAGRQRGGGGGGVSRGCYRGGSPHLPPPKKIPKRWVPRVGSVRSALPPGPGTHRAGLGGTASARSPPPRRLQRPEPPGLRGASRRRGGARLSGAERPRGAPPRPPAATARRAAQRRAPRHPPRVEAGARVGRDAAFPDGRPPRRDGARFSPAGGRDGWLESGRGWIATRELFETRLVADALPPSVKNPPFGLNARFSARWGYALGGKVALRPRQPLGMTA